MREKICSVENCESKIKALGFCNKHYQRLKTYGNVNFVKQERHGLKKSEEYSTYTNMKTRCYNPNSESFKDYGERGITVCDRWKNSFTAFYEDMGPKPFKRAQIDRKNNDGNYEPGNCHWTTHTQNMRNRRCSKLNEKDVIKIKDLLKVNSIRAVAKLFKVSPSTICDIKKKRTWKEI